MPCPVLTGSVTDQDTGDPIAGATVTVLNTTPPDTLTGTTDPNGNYTIPNVCLPRDSVWSVKARAAGYTSVILSTPPLPGTGTVTLDFKLKRVTAPQVPHVIDFTLFWGPMAPAQRDLDSHLSGPDPSWRGPWDPTGAYTANDRVDHQGGSWLCTADVAAPAAGQNPTPDTDPGHWQPTTLTVNGRFHCLLSAEDPVNSSRSTATTPTGRGPSTSSSPAG